MVRSAPVSGRRPSLRRAFAALACTALAALVVGTAPAVPAPGGTPSTSLERAERSAVLELYAAESALARARGVAATLGRRAVAARTLEGRARRHAALVRRSLGLTRARVATTLRALYVEGDRADPIAVVLGAETLDAAIDGLEGLVHVVEGQRRLAAQLVSDEAALARSAARARQASERAGRARAAAEGAVARLSLAVTARSQTLARIRARRAASAASLARLEATARAAVGRERALRGATPAPATPPTPSAPAATVDSASPGGTRTLVVDAVAYHLPGRTASGLPVGIGVIAVDPNVIPLGTRVFVPGYGPAVAADVGTAIKGNIIDLWMPSTAQARAWGRRTVTITIYR